LKVIIEKYLGSFASELEGKGEILEDMTNFWDKIMG
jgi:hypothetical protein